MTNLELNTRYFGPLLTIEDISPKWAERFRQVPLPIFSLKNLLWNLESIAVERCVVGEAYGFSDTYLKSCEKCEIIGRNFHTSLVTRSYDKLQKNIQTFVQHWNEKHASITFKLRKLKIPFVT